MILVEPVSRPVSLVAVHEQFPDRFPYLLESVAAGGPQARYSLLLARGTGQLTLTAPGRLEGRVSDPEGGFLANLDAWWADVAVREMTSDLPFVGGWFVYLGYELAAQIEPVLRLPDPGDGLPRAQATRCPGAIIVDHAGGETFLVAEDDKTLKTLRHAIANVAGLSANPDPGPLQVEEEDPARFSAALTRVHEYILAGDVFQVNLSRRWRVNGAISPQYAYRQLSAANPAPFAASARFGNRTIVSSSPERLVSVRGDRVSTRPIAGTRPRGDGEEDRRLLAELVAHPKERAEHIMLIDLERNDLGRVCEPGSVEVDELMVTESYTHVHHIVSNVTGRLRREVTPGGTMAAVFPGGTITGCPKVRCMQIIAELECEGRGAYTGSLGYLDRRGHMDLNILIRTAVVDEAGVIFRAGAGLVADSRFTSELGETRAKARGLLKAFGS